MTEKKPYQQSQKNDESLLNEQQAAKFLNVSRMTVLRLRQRGAVKFYRVGNRVLYSKQQHLLPFLESCQHIADNEISANDNGISAE